VALFALAALVLTVGCRSTKTDRIRYLEAENAKLSAKNSSLSDDLASEQSARYREAEAREKAEAESLAKDATIRALAERRRQMREDLASTPGVSYDENDNIITISSDITFKPGQATLTAQAEKTLAEVARAVQQRQFRAIRILGHTDSDPIKRSGWDSNEHLSLARAESVRKMLANQGIQPTLMETKGLGASKPIDSNKTAAGKARNRRVEIVLVEP
jgi:flagellar motor protein MotB